MPIKRLWQPQRKHKEATREGQFVGVLCQMSMAFVMCKTMKFRSGVCSIYLLLSSLADMLIKLEN